MKKIMALILGSAISLSLFAGCNSPKTNEKSQISSSVTEEGKSKSIVIAQSANFSAGFATEMHSYECTYYLNNWYDTLYEMKGDQFVPSLATDYKVSDDGLVYTFTLREGVKFSDGTDFNAQAVKLYFDNMRPTIGASANYGQLDMYTKEITVDSDYAFSIHLSKPYFGVLKDLAMICPRGIMSAAAFHADGSVNSEYLMSNTAGTGPYMFESVNDTATEYSFVSNPYYWGEKPDVESFTVKIIPDSKVSAMKTGEVDFVMGSDTLDATSYIEISSWDQFEGVKSDINTATEFIALNSDIAPFDDSKVRTAIQMGIDKLAIVDHLHNGLKTAADSVLSSQLPYCNGVSVKTVEYNPDAAKLALDDAGYKDTNGDGYREMGGKKLSFQLTYPSTGAYDKTVLAIQGFMKDLGIEITTNPIDLMTFMQKIFMEYDYEMTCYISYWIPYDPYTFIANMYPSMDYTDPSGIFSTDPQAAKALALMPAEDAKALIAGVYSTDNGDVIKEIYSKAIDCANESSVIIPIDYTNEYAVYNTQTIQSYAFNPIPNHVDVGAIKLQ